MMNLAIFSIITNYSALGSFPGLLLLTQKTIKSINYVLMKEVTKIQAII